MKSTMKIIAAQYKEQGESCGQICTRLVLLLCKYNILITWRFVLSSMVSCNTLALYIERIAY